jgi:HEAT repeat protein
VSEQQTADLDQLRAELRDTRQIVVLSLMQQQSASERLRGVSWSNRIEKPDTEILSALLDTLMHDPNVNVRLAAVDALKKFGESQIVRRGTLQALMEQDSAVVQVALIDFMVELQDKDSVETLRTFARDMTVNEGVRQRAAWSLGQFQ